MEEFFRRLQQRKLMQWALAYVAAAFALLQIADIVGQRFGWPEQAIRLLIIALTIGFVVTLVLAWYHGERGMQRVTGMELSILALVLAVGGVLLWRIARTTAGIDTRASITANAAVGPQSIAVLPLVNTSGDPANEYFSDGMSEELINTLAKVRELTVIGRNSSFQFKGKSEDSKEIAAKLGVAYLLEGSVRKASGRVRIAVDLVRASNGANVWSETFDRELKDVFAVQSEIATAVVGQLQSVLTEGSGAPIAIRADAPPSGNVDAYTAFLQGKFFAARHNADDYRNAIEQFATAVRIDPLYAEAWARMANTQAVLAANYLQGDEAEKLYTDAGAASDTALRLAPDLAYAHIARGALLVFVGFDFRGAEAEFRRAAELAPQSAEAKAGLGTMLLRLGRVAQAVEMHRAALVTDPRVASFHDRLAVELYALGRLDEAEAAEAKAIELQPNAAIYHVVLVFIAIQRSDAAAALAAARARTTPDLWQRCMLALALQIGSDRAAADAALQALIDHDADAMGFQIAEVYAVRREPDKMFEWLDRAWTKKDPGLTFLLFDPLTLRYRDDPRYAALVKRVGLPLENLATTDAVSTPNARAASDRKADAPIHDPFRAADAR